MVILQEGDMLVYDRITHQRQFMRGAEVLEDGNKDGKEVIGQRNLSELRDFANENARRYGLVAELFRERQDACFFVFKKLRA